MHKISLKVFIGISLTVLIFSSTSTGDSAGIGARISDQSVEPIIWDHVGPHLGSDDPESNLHYIQEGGSLGVDQGLSAPSAAGVPDRYGYIWNSKAFTDYNTQTGTILNLSGDSNNQYSDPITLPFSFQVIMRILIPLSILLLLATLALPIQAIGPGSYICLMM